MDKKQHVVLSEYIFIQAFVEDVPYRIIAEKTGLTETAARKRAFDIYEDHEMLKEQELHHMIATHLEICVDKEFKSEDEAYDDDLYESLYNELEKRASSTVLHIGFTFEFIDIFAGHTPASKVADYIGNLHQLLDEIGDEIDGIL